MHFRLQRLIFTATRHSHIDNQSSIMQKIECQQQEMVFSLTTPTLQSFMYPVVRLRSLWFTLHSKISGFASDHWATFKYSRVCLFAFELIGFYITPGCTKTMQENWIPSHKDEINHDFSSLWLPSSTSNKPFHPNSRSKNTLSEDWWHQQTTWI